MKRFNNHSNFIGNRPRLTPRLDLHNHASSASGTMHANQREKLNSVVVGANHAPAWPAASLSLPPFNIIAHSHENERLLKKSAGVSPSN